MTSWRLFTYLTPFGAPSPHRPIWRREFGRSPGWMLDALWSRLRDSTTRLIALAALSAPALCCWCSALYETRPTLLTALLYAVLIPIAILPSLLWWVLPLSITIGPSIARERMHQTWDLLRVTPADIESIVLTKLYAAAWPLFSWMQLTRSFILLAALPAAILSLNLLDSLTDTYPALQRLTCGVAVVLLGAGAGLFVLDRMQQAVLMGVAAMSASASATSAQRGIVHAAIAVGLAWLMDTGIAALMVTALPRSTTLSLTGRALFLSMLGPTGSYLAELRIHEAAACIAATLLLREVAIRAVWWWTVRLATTV